ncbi:MAG TPA: heavy metal-associated domain-containing protein, partial [Aquabacterium sp.]|nr:heavy metal-associated domain-containing protein [Aquabacterium sp.]
MQSATIADPGLEAPAASPSAWAALDEPAAWQEFSRPSAGRPGLWESYLAIEGMYCASCTLAVEEALARAPGIQEVQVNGTTAVARVVWSPAAGRPSQWLQALKRAGYGGLPAG